MGYRKVIKITDTGMVTASVFCGDGRRVGLKFFSSIFHTTKGTEKKAINAHKWADDHMVMCSEQEHGGE